MTPAGSGRGLDCAAAPLDTTRGRREGPFPKNKAPPSEPHVMSTGGSTAESRSGDISTNPASPNGSNTPERLQRARGGVSTALPLRSTRPEAGGGGISLRPSRRLDQSLAPEAARRDPHGIGIPERTPHSRTAPARPGRGLDFTSFRSTRPEAGGGGRFIINASSLMRRRRCECRGLPAPAPSARASRGASPRRGAPLD